ncbi:MAG: hypothetical protein Q8K67_11260 [Geothrix sp.]|nr:hypothetical protein [Geothrix sp.]
MSQITILHRPFNPLALQFHAAQQAQRQPMGWTPWTPLDDYEQMEGLGSFLKKAAKSITKIARAPIKLVAPKLAKKLEKIDNKIIDNVDSVHTKINVAAKKAGKSVGKFVKKNWKWIIVAAAIAITIYSMGSGSTIAAKMMSGLTKVKGYIATGKEWAGAKLKSGWKAVTSGMTKLLNGKKFGELNPNEVEALAEANEQSGESLIPWEVLGMIGKKALTPSEQTASDAMQFQSEGGGFPGAEYPGQGAGGGAEYPGQGAGGGAGFPVGPSSASPSWLMPALIGAGALVLIMAVT